MNELQLIKRAIKRDASAQRKLYDHYRTYWYMLSLRYNRQESDALDVLQEALVQIFTKLDQFDPKRGAFKSWSGRIVINQSLMAIRKKRPEREEDLDHHQDIMSSEEDAIDMLSNQELTKLIQKLPGGYRTVFNMYVLDGYSHKEIAETLGVSEGTSKSQLFKAKKMLREHLEVLYMT